MTVAGTSDEFAFDGGAGAGGVSFVGFVGFRDLTGFLLVVAFNVAGTVAVVTKNMKKEGRNILCYIWIMKLCLYFTTYVVGVLVAVLVQVSVLVSALLVLVMFVSV